MIKTRISILIVFITSFCFANEGDKKKIKNELYKVYKAFNESINTKEADKHRDLFLYDTAPVNSLPINANGVMDYYGSNVNAWISYFSKPDFDYEVKMSDVKFEILNESFAVSEAHFEEHRSGEMATSGKDIFVYVKTTDGWKIAIMHNTLRHANDSTNFSEPFKFNNDPIELPGKLREKLNDKDKFGFAGLFHSGLGQYFTVKDEFGKFNYAYNTVAGVTDNLTRTPATFNFKYSNISTKTYDNYIAIITLDYEVLINGKDKKSGNKVLICYATTYAGWKISSAYTLPN